MTYLHIIPIKNEIEESLTLCEKYNAVFEYQDFFMPDILDDEKELNNRIDFYNSLERNHSDDIMHGAFFDIVLSSYDKKMATLSLMRTEQSLKIAKLLGCKAVVFHSTYKNILSSEYDKMWLDDHVRIWHGLLKKYPDITILVENMFDYTPDMLLKICESINETEHFGICFDVGHANLSTVTIDEWFEKLGKYIKYIHYSDNMSISDSHLPIGYGNINWDNINEKIHRYVGKPDVLIEVTALNAQKISLQFLFNNNIYPFNM